ITPTGAAQRLFGDPVTEKFIHRSASAPATTTGAGWADALVRESVFDAIQVATSLSAGASLVASALQVSLAGPTQSIVPRRVVGAAAAGQWVAEGAAIPVRAQSFSAVTLLRRKLAVIAVFTRETAEGSNIEAIMRQTLGEASGLALDAAMLSAAP